MSTKGRNLIAAIALGELDDEIEAIQDAARAREKIVFQNRAEALKEGDRVRLTGLSPKALNGALGTVQSRRATKVVVLIDKEFARGTGRAQFSIERGFPLTVPAACVVPVPA